MIFGFEIFELDSKFCLKIKFPLQRGMNMSHHKYIKDILMLSPSDRRIINTPFDCYHFEDPFRQNLFLLFTELLTIEI